MSESLYPSAVREITAFSPSDPALRAVRDEFLVALDAGAAITARAPLPSHLTASVFAFAPDRREVLLVWHRKGQFWVQPGGHLEGDDADVADSARRELREETGAVAGAVVLTDLDHHALPGAFGACRSHLDLGFAVVLGERVTPVVSDESEAVRWWPVDALPAPLAGGVERRVRAALRGVDARGTDRTRPAVACQDGGAGQPRGRERGRS